MGIPGKWVEGCELFSLLMHLARPFVCVHISMACLDQPFLKGAVCSYCCLVGPKESSQWFEEGEKRVTRRGKAKGTFLVQALIYTAKGHEVQLSPKWAVFQRQSWLSANLAWWSLPVCLESVAWPFKHTHRFSDWDHLLILIIACRKYIKDLYSSLNMFCCSSVMKHSGYINWQMHTWSMFLALETANLKKSNI